MPSSPLIFSVYFLSLVHISPGPIAQAATFNPNCTLPSSSTNFVAAPNTRGTLSILWNCLSVIILCTWNIQHLNIPPRRPYYDKSGRKIGWLRVTWWAVLDLRTSLRWMLLTILVPEYIMGKALSERLAAVNSLGSLRSQFGEEMEIVHAYIMNMGGYYLDFSEVSFCGVDISNVNSTGSSEFSTTAVDYSGIYFSGNHVASNSQPSQTASKTVNPTRKDLSGACVSSNSPDVLSPPARAPAPADKEISGIARPEKYNESECESEPRTGSCMPESPDTSSNSRPPEIPGPNEIENSGHVVSKPPPQQISTGNLSLFQILNLSRFKQERWALTALQLLSAKGFKLYDSLPQISLQELDALNNSDSLVKLIAMTQIVWLMIQLLVRYRNNLVSSQLEIAALAFSVCSMLTYAILWNRPRGVTMRYRVNAVKAPKPDEIILLATSGPGYLWTWHLFEENEDDSLHLMPIPNDASHAVNVRTLVGGFENTVVGRTLVEWLRFNHPAVVSVIAGSVLGGTLFGGMHCLAWNLSFPTHAELILWRTCSIMTTVLPVLSVYFNLQWSHYNGWAEELEDTTERRLHGPILLTCFIFPYILARLFLIGETFRSLFFLPPEAFIDTWPGAFLLWG